MSEGLLDHLTSAVDPTLFSPEQWRSFEEAQATMQALARSHAPADADLRQLVRTLTESEAALANDQDDVHRAELLLRKAQARYQALVEQIPAVTFMAPLDGTTSELYVSPQVEALLGFSAEEWLGNPVLWYAQLHPEDKERWQAMFARTLNAGERFCSDYRFLARDGRIVWVHGEAKVVSDADGRPLFLQGVAFDITERMEAEGRLQQTNVHLARARDQALEASRAKTAFLANMSHELRTPLNAILGFAEMMQLDAEETGNQVILPDLQKIQAASRHLLSMIGGILDLSKIEAGKMELFLESFDLKTVVQDVVATALPVVEENGNVLEVICPGDLGTMHADVTKVRQVLFNLLSNAGKFTEQGNITLEASRAGDWVQMRVSDTGIGIPADQQEKLFQSFSQGDDSTTRKYGGTGLGLAISQRFCQMMGGSITVESEVGVGSVFTLRLPAEVAPLEEAEADETAAPVPVPPPLLAPAAPSVLVIDDDPQVHEVMKRFLAREAVAVHTATGGADGLRVAREVRPSVISLDVCLPDMEGWQVLTALKADPELANIPVILLTLEQDENRGFALGAAEYLTKPIDWGRLAEILRKYRGGKAESRVLVVDDSATNRELLARMVIPAGWTVIEAADGREALTCVADMPPDLILLDLMMPEMDGFEFLRILRKTQAGQSVPVVIVTAKELTAQEQRVLSGSVQKILQKGAFTYDELLREVQGLLADNLRAAAPPAANGKPAGGDGANTASPLLQALKRQLEQARSERDTALARLDGTGAGPPDLSNRQRELEEELAQATHRTRELEQTVELLLAEREENGAGEPATADVHAQLEELRAERDTAVHERDAAQARLRAARPKQKKNSDTVRRLRKKLSQLRRQQPDPGQQFQQLRALMETMATREARSPREQESPSVPQRLREQRSPLDGAHQAETRHRRPPSSDEPNWQVVHHDDDGVPHSLTGSTEEVREWLESGRLHDPGSVLARSGKGGGFELLSSYPEFRDLVLPPARQRRKAPKSAEKDDTAGTAFPEWMKWAGVLVLIVLTTVLTRLFLLK